VISIGCDGIGFSSALSAELILQGILSTHASGNKLQEGGVG
jgi:hypothetical protein